MRKRSEQVGMNIYFHLLKKYKKGRAKKGQILEASCRLSGGMPISTRLEVHLISAAIARIRGYARGWTGRIAQMWLDT